MPFQVQVKKEVPVGVTLARFLPQFADEFNALATINATTPQPTNVATIVSQEIVETANGPVSVSFSEFDFATLEDAVASSDATKNWVHPLVTAYNQENNVKTYNRIVNVDTQEVVRDWEQRW